MLRAWVFCGCFFMALSGNLLGFSNLMAISAHHGMAKREQVREDGVLVEPV